MIDGWRYSILTTFTASVIIAWTVQAHAGLGMSPVRQSAFSGIMLPGSFVLLAAETEQNELEQWKSIQESGNPDDFADFLDHFPNGTFASIAKVRLKALRNATTSIDPALVHEQNTVWEAIKGANSTALLEAFLQSYPDSNHGAQARILLAGLSTEQNNVTETDNTQNESALWNVAKLSDNRAGYQAYLDAFPNGRYANIAKARLATNQTASVSTSTKTSNGGTVSSGNGNPYDGQWKLTATHLHGPYGRIPFCRSRETMHTTFAVNFGEFKHQSRTNKGAPVNVEGQFSRSGRLLLDVIPWGPNESGGWGNNVERGNLRIEENMKGKNRVSSIVGEDCKVELVLTRQ